MTLRQLEQAGLRNKNRGRDIDKRPFDARIMGIEDSLLDISKGQIWIIAQKVIQKIDSSVLEIEDVG